MSSRRSRESRITEVHDINKLAVKLLAVASEIQLTGTTSRASASKILKETCNYIRKLQREMGELSERLSALMASMDIDSAEAELVLSVLIQR